MKTILLLFGIAVLMRLFLHSTIGRLCCFIIKDILYVSRLGIEIMKFTIKRSYKTTKDFYKFIDKQYNKYKKQNKEDKKDDMDINNIKAINGNNCIDFISYKNKKEKGN